MNSSYSAPGSSKPHASPTLEVTPDESEIETTARLERSRAYQQIWKERLTVTSVMVGLAVLFVFLLVTILAGAESGTGARPMDEAWVKSICDACVSENIPFFGSGLIRTDKLRDGYEGHQVLSL